MKNTHIFYSTIKKLNEKNIYCSYTNCNLKVLIKQHWNKKKLKKF